jgi:acetyl esterase/lipase
MKLTLSTAIFVALICVCSAQVSPTPTPCTLCVPTPMPSCPPYYPPCPSPSPAPFTFPADPACPVTATPWPNDQHPYVTVPSTYQPNTHVIPGGAPLGWRVFAPSSGRKRPAILLIHGGGFNSNAHGPFHDNRLDNIATDLANAGYYTLVVGYRLARPGLIPDQECHDNEASMDMSGVAPTQSKDIEALIRAARADSHCNGKVGVLGGSAGATHAMYAALDTHRDPVGTWPQWNTFRTDLPDAAIGLSGAYDFADRTALPYCDRKGGDILDLFQMDIENYTRKVCALDQLPLSPVGVLDNYNHHTVLPPLLFFSAPDDAVPITQLTDLSCALDNMGIPYTAEIVTGDQNCHKHSFDYWTAVSTEVICFFNAYLTPNPCSN